MYIQCLNLAFSEVLLPNETLAVNEVRSINGSNYGTYVCVPLRAYYLRFVFIPSSHLSGYVMHYTSNTIYMLS